MWQCKCEWDENFNMVQFAGGFAVNSNCMFKSQHHSTHHRKVQNLNSYHFFDWLSQSINIEFWSSLSKRTTEKRTRKIDIQTLGCHNSTMSKWQNCSFLRTDFGLVWLIFWYERGRLSCCVNAFTLCVNFPIPLCMKFMLLFHRSQVFIMLRFMAERNFFLVYAMLRFVCTVGVWSVKTPKAEPMLKNRRLDSRDHFFAILSIQHTHTHTHRPKFSTSINYSWFNGIRPENSMV